MAVPTFNEIEGTVYDNNGQYYKLYWSGGGVYHVYANNHVEFVRENSITGSTVPNSPVAISAVAPPQAVANQELGNANVVTTGSIGAPPQVEANKAIGNADVVTTDVSSAPSSSSTLPNDGPAQALSNEALNKQGLGNASAISTGTSGAPGLSAAVLPNSGGPNGGDGTGGTSPSGSSTLSSIEADAKKTPQPPSLASDGGGNSAFTQIVSESHNLPTKPHLVNNGDTFWQLETDNNWPHGTLQSLNPNVNPHDLAVGSNINVPSTSGTIGAADFPPHSSYDNITVGSGVQTAAQDLAKGGSTTANDSPSPESQVLEGPEKPNTGIIKTEENKGHIF